MLCVNRYVCIHVRTYIVYINLYIMYVCMYVCIRSQFSYLERHQLSIGASAADQNLELDRFGRQSRIRNGLLSHIAL